MEVVRVDKGEMKTREEIIAEILQQDKLDFERHAKSDYYQTYELLHLRQRYSTILRDLVFR